jgi:hypothetical protein
MIRGEVRQSPAKAITQHVNSDHSKRKERKLMLPGCSIVRAHPAEFDSRGLVDTELFKKHRVIGPVR